MALTANSYFCILNGARLSEKCLNYGRKMMSSERVHAPRLKYVAHKYGLVDVEEIVRNVPKSLWKARSDFIVTYSFVVHQKTAETIADTVMDSVSKKKKMPIVIELNPGLGLVTKELFKRGLQNLVVYNPYCFFSFNMILQQYRTKIKLHEINAFNTTLNYGKDFYFRFFQHLSDLKDTKVIIIGMCPNRLFYRRLIYYITNISLHLCTNAEFYVTIPDQIYHCLTSSEVRNFRVCDYGCFGVLFDMEILDQYSRDYFLPLSQRTSTNVYFVRLSRKDLILSKHELLLYMNFLKVIGSRKSNNVIGELEKWFPGSGPYLIAAGVSATNQTFEYKVNDLLYLFRLVQGLRGYEDSFFIMKNYSENWDHEPKVCE